MLTVMDAAEDAEPPAPALCQDDGCEHHGTPHVCITHVD